MPLVQIGEWTEVVLRQTIALRTTFSACAGLSSMQLGLDDEWLPQILEIQKELKELTTAEVLRKECITERPPHARAHEYRGNTIPQLAAILSKTIPVLYAHLKSITLWSLRPGPPVLAPRPARDGVPRPHRLHTRPSRRLHPPRRTPGWHTPTTSPCTASMATGSPGCRSAAAISTGAAATTDIVRVRPACH